ncbi:MAG: VOC family protein [Marinobacter sp.]|uniref:VOC family protein n=1 Tax=Marinobacter sp. TaxID=50741 RepID=UPI00299EE237|nr:VOC family protein [Marinobacter sp.]MDX1756218.1 VOC family protein [Marinobacter sp.]
MNSLAYYEIQADDPERAIRFYETVFGWQFQRQEGLPVDYWRIRSEGIQGGLLQRPAATPPPECGTNGYVCSLQVADFDTTARRIEQAGGQIALPRFPVPGVCWQGYFIDPEGNTFGIFQVDTEAG